MADDGRTSPTALARRDLIGVTAAATVLAAGLTATARAQTPAPLPPAPLPPETRPGQVVLEKRGAVLLIDIDRPDAQNQLDVPILVGLGKAYYQLDHDDELRVGVLHGVGPDFSHGLDVSSFIAGLAAGTFPPKDPDYLNPAGTRLPYRVKPVVVAVQGDTWYGGHELFLNADIRVAASNTRFRQGEVIRAGMPAGGATIRFTREAGWGNAMRYMLTGDEWGVEEAHRFGLVQEVTAPGQQLDRAIELAQKVAAAAPLGVRATLASAHQALAGEEPAFAALLGQFASLLKTEDVKEARRAAQERRAPVFRGI